MSVLKPYKSFLNESKFFLEVLHLIHKMKNDTLINTFKLTNVNVITIPGFLASNEYLKPFNNYLKDNGCAVYSVPFKRRRNLDFTEESLSKMIDLVKKINNISDSPIYVVGHSLGGCYARSLANRTPDLIKGIITIGSPYMLNPEKDIPPIGHVFKLLNKTHEESYLMLDEIKNIPVHIKNLAIWSDIDGVVAPEVCYKESDRHLKITCSHIGMGYNAVILEEVLSTLCEFEST